MTCRLPDSSCYVGGASWLLASSVPAGACAHWNHSPGTRSTGLVTNPVSRSAINTSVPAGARAHWNHGPR